MTTQDTVNTGDQADVTVSETTTEAPPQLREARDRALEKADTYRQELVKVRLADIGLSPDEGLGIAVAESFKGEPTLEAIAQHAQEKYRYTFDASTPTTPAGVLSPAEQLLQQQRTVGDQVMASAQSAQPDESLQQAASVVNEKLENGEVASQREIQAGIAAKMQSFAGR